MSSRPIYLDHAATTPTDPRVAELVMRLLVDEYGNAGSRTHSYGTAAAREVALARERLTGPVAASPDEVAFTSGATESDNLAILGLAAAGVASGRRHVVSTAIEHKAVLEPLARLAAEGFEVTLVRPDGHGHVSPVDVLSAVRTDTLLVSIMHANNETGAVQPVSEVADGLESDAGPFLHVDAAQTFGRLTDALRHPRIDLVSLSGHKVFGPKGVGALVTRKRRGVRPPLRPLMVGGGQERGLRPGTQPVALIAGFGLAAELAESERAKRMEACSAIRHSALSAFAALEGVVVHGDPGRGVLPNVLSLAVPGLDSEAAMVALKGLVALSNGSACTSSSYDQSHVLRAMGLPKDQLEGTMRLSWGHETPAVPWDEVVSILADLRI